MSHISVDYHGIHVHSFFGTNAQRETVRCALHSFGFLIKSVAKRDFTFAGFAEKIRGTHSMSVPQTEHVVKVLEQLHAQNSD